MLDPWQLREGGHVQRCHVIPHDGSYTVDSHSWQAAALLLALHPDPSRSLLTAILLHDVQERWTGDLPLPGGDEFDSLRSGYEKAEDVIRQRLGLPDLLTSLTVDELGWFKAVDKLELLMWCLDEEAKGNRHVQRVHENLTRWFETHSVPSEVGQFMERLEWRRSADFLR